MSYSGSMQHNKIALDRTRAWKMYRSFPNRGHHWYQGTTEHSKGGGAEDADHDRENREEGSDRAEPSVAEIAHGGRGTMDDMTPVLKYRSGF